ncbi:MAG: AI-2E family transporter [Pseudomonas sp.]|jgi:AI-2 transport protein TqsA|nr:AI-2E family transporter [Pseudomonas sp.]
MQSYLPPSSRSYSTALQWLLGAAALVVVLGGLKAISHILTPFLLAAFLAIICAPPLSWMQRRGIPGPVSILVLFSVVGLTFFLLFLALKGAAESMATQAPLYQARFAGWMVELREMIAARGLPAELLPATMPLPATATITGVARDLAGGLGQFTASTLLVLLAFMFLLLEERTFAGKLNAAFPSRRRARVRGRRFLRSVYRYLVIKTAASTATGAIVGLGLTFMGVDFAVLWAIVAGLLNFIPTIGSIIAAIPAVIIAFMGMGIVEGLMVLVLYVAVNTIIGSILEPRLMGRSLGLSPLVVLISLLLWGYVFGPIGMLLAVPLTMIAKLALDSSPQTRWAGIMMSDTAKRMRT